MKSYSITTKDADRLRQAHNLLVANEQAMNVAISRCIQDRASAIELYNSTWKDIKNKYEIREGPENLLFDGYINQIKVRKGAES